GKILVDPVEIGRDRAAVMPAHCADLEILRHGQPGERAATFRYMRYAASRDVLGGEPADRLAVEADVPRCANRPAERAQGGGLAAAVGPEHGRNPAGGNFEIEVEQDLGGAVECAKAAYFEESVQCRLVPR